MKGVVDVAPFLLFPAMYVCKYGLRNHGFMSIFRRISYETRFRQNQPYVHSLVLSLYVAYNPSNHGLFTYPVLALHYQSLTSCLR